MNNRIHIVLEERGKNYRWLAEQLEKAPSTIRNWCNNKTQPSINTLERIADIFEVDKFDLVTTLYEIKNDRQYRKRKGHSVL